MWVLQTENIYDVYNTIHLNKTQVSNLCKFKVVLMPEIYMKEVFKSKCKIRSLLIANGLMNLFRKLYKDQKSSTLEIQKDLFMKTSNKDHFWS